MSRLTVRDALRMAADRLAAVADNPRLEARLLLAHALAVTPADLIRDPDCGVETDGFEPLLARRQAREPLALITGHREFWSLDFLVSPATLIPRPDSETVVEAALSAFRDREPPARILDLGTGTGCLLLALLSEFPSAFGVGTDIALAAAALAQVNARRLGLAGRSGFAAGNWTDAVAGRFDLVVSNPPYIAHPALAGLMPEVRRFEPTTALNGGLDGYDAYRCLMLRLPAVLRGDGVAVLELGAGQAEMVGEMARGAGFRVSLRLDLGGIPRAMILNGWNA